MITCISHVRATCVFALCLASSTLVMAQEPSAKIVEYGRYTSTVSAIEPPAGTAGGAGVRAKGRTLAKSTTKIPAKLGELFGICVLFSDLPKDRGCTVRKEMHHPPFQEPNGAIVTNSVDVMRFRAGASSDECSFFGWSFLEGYEYELVPGKWTCTIYIDDKEVASMAFEVKKVNGQH